MAIVFLAFGSNLGDREAHITNAYKLLAENGVRIIRTSTLIETEPVGGPAQGLFMNSVVKVETAFDPHALLGIVHNIEKALGRVRDVQNGPRTIDIDILLYDDQKIDTIDLKIPHPRMRERGFVMQPLCEIAPELKLS